jgi:sugar O-acyltransferase (sialic acid O-acetyltransferase NeuD family)
MHGQCRIPQQKLQPPANDNFSPQIETTSRRIAFLGGGEQYGDNEAPPLHPSVDKRDRTRLARESLIDEVHSPTRNHEPPAETRELRKKLKPQEHPLATPVITALFGAGGFAREVMPMLSLATNAARRIGGVNNCVFVETEPSQQECNGHPVISESQFLNDSHSVRFFNVAVADSSARERIAEKFLGHGINPVSIHSATSSVCESSTIAEGSILCANTVITANSRIGRFFHLNIFSYVAHDCVIGDFVTFAPNVHCNGNIIIEDHAYIGTGAILKQGKPGHPLIIGTGAIVGMGAVVTKDVPPHTTVVGNPARQLQR